MQPFGKNSDTHHKYADCDSVLCSAAASQKIPGNDKTQIANLADRICLNTFS